MQQIPASLLTLLAGIVVTLISFWVGQNNHWLPEAASLQAPLVDQLFNVMVTIGTALFIIVQGALIYAMIRFRKPAGDETDGSDVEGNLSLEILWTAIPAVIVIGLGVYSVDVYQQMGGFQSGSAGMVSHAHHHETSDQTTQMVSATMSSDQALETATPHDLIATSYGLGAADNEVDVVVNVTAMQFAWLFEYPDQGITMGELHVPLGKKVKLQMKALDVLHAFWVPQFRLKQDVMPGLDSQLQFTATKAGTYPIFCAELCGAYHGSMQSQVVVESPAEFSEWLKQSQLAQIDQPQTTIAQVPQSDADRLQPYAQKLGVDAQALGLLQAAL